MDIGNIDQQEPNKQFLPHTFEIITVEKNAQIPA